MAIRYEKHGGIAIFTIDRPEARNAMNAQGMHRECTGNARAQQQDGGVCWRPELMGWYYYRYPGDKAFWGGADIKEMLSFQQAHPGQYWERPDTPMRGLEIWKPLIAAINGVALGGGLEIALASTLAQKDGQCRLAGTQDRQGIL